MNTDIRIKTTFLTHHKTIRLKRKLGPEGILSLIALWLYVAQYRPDGDISDLDPEDIAAVSMWEKDPYHFLSSLIEVGFVDECLTQEGEIKRKIHDWAEHNPYAASAQLRSEIAREMAKKRWGKKYNPDKLKSLNQTNLSSHANSNANSIPNSTANSNTYSNAPYPIPSPIPIPNPIPIPDPNIKEKNNISIDSHAIKDKNCSEKMSNCTQLTVVNFVPSTQKENSEIISFVGKSFKGIEMFIDIWKDAYPLVDIEAEIKQMEAWLLSQPRTRWKKNWKRFITNWLSREQDKKEMRIALNTNKRGFLDD